MSGALMSDSRLFPITVVGSMPRPQDGLGDAGSRLAPDVLRSRMDSAAWFMIVMMESAGVDIIFDGEWRRRSYINVVAQMVDGFVPVYQYSARTDVHCFTVEWPLHNPRHLSSPDRRGASR